MLRWLGRLGVLIAMLYSGEVQVFGLHNHVIDTMRFLNCKKPYISTFSKFVLGNVARSKNDVNP